MADTGTGTVHDHRVKTVEAHDAEEITRLDQVRINGDLLSRALLKLDTQGLLDEFDVGLFHIRWHMRADDGPAWVVSDATNESLERRPQRLDVLNHVFAESEGFYATIADISLSLRRVHLEGESVGTVEGKQLEVLDLGVGEEDDILAELALGISGVDNHVERGLIDSFVLKRDLLEAAAYVGRLWVLGANIASKHGQ